MTSSISNEEEESASPINPRPTISTNIDSSSPLIALHVSAQLPLKLTSTNYAAWRAQFESLLIGYDLLGYVDGSVVAPPLTVTDPVTATDSLNPAYSFWNRQDKLILNGIIGSISPALVPFIAAKKTSFAAWSSLEKTYASPSRGRIMELRQKLRAPIKGTRTITEYMMDIQSTIDSLALMRINQLILMTCLSVS